MWHWNKLNWRQFYFERIFKCNSNPVEIILMFVSVWFLHHLTLRWKALHAEALSPFPTTLNHYQSIDTMNYSIVISFFSTDYTCNFTRIPHRIYSICHKLATSRTSRSKADKIICHQTASRPAWFNGTSLIGKPDALGEGKRWNLTPLMILITMCSGQSNTKELSLLGNTV